uniref:Fibronectin type-III domain-containing protein n=1 Tax=candidate division CPR3 bacterium TaxID=2268181 RepID=A0A7C5YXN7_UNCC3
MTKCRNMECSEYVTTQISDPGSTGYHTSIAIGVDGLPVISYSNLTDGDLMVTKCRNMECSEYVTTQISDPDVVGYFTSIAIGVDGLPVISHLNIIDEDLMVTKCADPSCAYNVQYPDPQSPPDGSVVTTKPFTLRWTTGTNAVRYQVKMMGRYLNWTSVPLSTTSYTVTNFKFYPGTQYKWMVRTCWDVNCRYTTPWSQPYTFWWQYNPGNPPMLN